jgi:hypothetical protein
MQQLDLTGMPPRSKTSEYMFMYEGFCTDVALRRDDPDMIERCYRNDWIDHSTKMFCGNTILNEAKKRSPKCAERLESLGFPETI